MGPPPPRYSRDTPAQLIAHDLARHIANKVILTTGVSSPDSLGFHFNETIAVHHPKLLILAGRDRGRTQAAADAIAAKTAGVKTRVLELDLASLASVRRAAEEVSGYEEEVDVLVNNAGVMACGFGRTEEGVERQFAVNHVGHFLFTNLVMGKVLGGFDGGGEGDEEKKKEEEKGKGESVEGKEREEEEEEEQVKRVVEKRERPRVVMVASDGYRLSPIRDDWNFKENEKDYNKWAAYGQSKTANMLFAVSLAEKLGGKGLLAFSLHPGVIGDTNLSRDVDQEDFESLKDYDRKLGNSHGWDGLKYTDPWRGVATHVFAAFDPALADDKDVNGSYCHNAQVAAKEDVRAWARDKVEAEKLWRLSEEICGQKFGY